jgi:phosphomannomutase
VGGIEEVGRLFGKVFGSPLALDLTDGARMTFAGNRIVHLRPSGNAPEFRCYSEAPSQDDAERINREALEIVAGMAAGESAG